MSMLLRRRMMTDDGGSPPTPPEPLGEFTHGYAATITPTDTDSLTIQHNLGVTPKVAIIEMVGEPTMTNYGIKAIYELDMLATQGAHTGFAVGEYHYSGSDSYAGKALPDAEVVTANTTSLTAYPIYSAARSPWDTGATYRVQVYG